MYKCFFVLVNLLCFGCQKEASFLPFYTRFLGSAIDTKKICGVQTKDGLLVVAAQKRGLINSVGTYFVSLDEKGEIKGELVVEEQGTEIEINSMTGLKNRNVVAIGTKKNLSDTSSSILLIFLNPQLQIERQQSIQIPGSASSGVSVRELGEGGLEIIAKVSDSLVYLSEVPVDNFASSSTRIPMESIVVINISSETFTIQDTISPLPKPYSELHAQSVNGELFIYGRKDSVLFVAPVRTSGDPRRWIFFNTKGFYLHRETMYQYQGTNNRSMTVHGLSEFNGKKYLCGTTVNVDNQTEGVLFTHDSYSAPVFNNNDYLEGFNDIYARNEKEIFITGYQEYEGNRDLILYWFDKNLSLKTPFKRKTVGTAVRNEGHLIFPDGNGGLILVVTLSEGADQKIAIYKIPSDDPFFQ